MRWIDRLNAKFGRYGVPNVTVLLIAGQVAAFVANQAPQQMGAEPLAQRMLLSPAHVLAGEWWQLFTFLFVPPATNPVFAFFGWYIFYLMGSALETEWGAFRYNLYLLLGYLASVALAFVTYFASGHFAAGIGDQGASNLYLYSTVFLAFARLYPDFVLSIMFIFPVKVRYLAMLTWISYGLTFLFSKYWLDQAMVVAATFNYLVFFGTQQLQDMRHRHRRMQFQSKAMASKNRSGLRCRRMAHTCAVCGLTSAQSSRTQFRYCTECDGDLCYCPEHIGNHEHVKSESAAENERAK